LRILVQLFLETVELFLGLHYSKAKKTPLHAVKVYLQWRYHFPKRGSSLKSVMVMVKYE